MIKNQPLLRTAALLALISTVSGCSTTKAPEPITSITPAVITPSPTVSPEGVASPANTNIGKVDETGTTVIVDVPDDEVCRRTTVTVTKAVFETCLIDGLTFVQVSNVFGYKGELLSQSGKTEIRKWSGGNGQIVLGTFNDGKLVSKSQSNLE